MTALDLMHLIGYLGLLAAFLALLIIFYRGFVALWCLLFRD